jgi:ribose 5-phosphate isomerase B
MGAKRIVVGCDCAAVGLKKAMIPLMRSGGWEVEDLGVDSPDDQTAYPEIAARVCRAVQRAGPGQRAVLFCGTGIGMAICANKFKGIYAAVVHDAYSAERAALSNDCNVVTMGARVVGERLAAKLLGEWLSLEYQGGSDTKLALIKGIEDESFR